MLKVSDEMNILLVGNQVGTKEKIKSYSMMQAYFLEQNLRELGVNTFFFPTHNVSNPDEFYTQIMKFCDDSRIDHIVALGVNFFGKCDKSIGFKLSCNFKGMVTQIHDGSVLDGVPIDLNFTIKDERERLKDNINNRLERHIHCNYLINWAADNSMFIPKQIKDGILRVFVDHSTFTDTYIDHSLTIMMNLKRLYDLINIGQIPDYHGMIVKTLTDNGVEIVDLNNILIKPYNRKSVSAIVFAKEISESDIFFVSHSESIGLCVLEAAMSGALVFIPDGMVNACLLNQVNHVCFYNRINWDNWSLIAEKLVPFQNSMVVQKYTWRAFTINLLNGLISMKKRDKKHKFPIIGRN